MAVILYFGVLLNDDVKILELTQFSSSRAAAAGGSDAVLHHYTVGPPVVVAAARLGVVVDLFSCSVFKSRPAGAQLKCLIRKKNIYLRHKVISLFGVLKLAIVYFSVAILT